MKTNLIIVLLFCMMVSGSIQAQTKLLNVPVQMKDTLGYSKIRCLYEQYIMTDTLNPQKLTKELMYLQISEEISKYMSYSIFHRDSLIADDRKKGNNVDVVDAVKNGRYQSSATDQSLLFKNFPKQKNTSHRRLAYDSYVYEEDIVKPVWKIEKEKTTILEYSCTKATTTFCGRNYTVWFSPDIPVSDGPWKFVGLPGLILRACDDKGQVTFECVQISKVSWPDPIVKPHLTRSTIKTTKNDFYKKAKQFSDNPSGVINNSTRRVTTTASKRILQKIPYNPVEILE